MKKTVFILLAFMTFSVIKGQVNLNQGLVGHFRLNGNGIDESFYHLNGTPYNTTTVPGHFGGNDTALSFNGYSSQFLSSTNNRGVYDTITFSAWVKTTSTTGTQMILVKYDWQADHGYHFIMANGYVFLAGRDGSNTYYSTTRTTFFIADGNWHFLLGEILGNVWTLYIDCASYDTFTTTTSYPNLANNEQLSLGYYPMGHNGDHQYFEGTIDEVRIYNRELTSDEKMELCKLYTGSIADNDTGSIKIYPNPAKNILKIENENFIQKIQIYDTTGKLISVINDNFKSINIENFKKGIYFVKINLDNKTIINKIFIKN